ncbi:hypothetical protein N0V94_003128 [Neodidymelliopsis sp. IMI 364377]|nr:hypothetical protein N0V94_003128 [Neodidymelliopsis sp. IMI 364377]
MQLSKTFLATIAIATTTVNGTLTRVTNFGLNPTGLQMNINVPTKLAQNPAVILALHGCFGTGELYAAQTTYNTLSEQKGFITIFPSSKRDSNCWEVNTAKGLSRNAGGDNQGLVSMINYTISKYSADPTKVFVTGSSSGCMMTNVLMDTPETGYTKIVYGDGKKLVGYEAKGVGHTVPVHETDDLAWFGL